MVDQPVALLRSEAPRHGEPVLDYYKWALEQAELLRAGNFDAVDLLNVIDEIEGVARSELRNLKSNVEVVLVHMLKWDHQPQKRSRSWGDSIAEHRDRIAEDLKDSPSLAGNREDVLVDAYRLARRRASRETRMPIDQFPEVCPYSWRDATEKPFAVDGGTL